MVKYLLSLHPLEITNIVAREPHSEAKNADYVINLLLIRFQINPGEFRQTFVLHKKESPASWYNFAFKLINFC